MLGPFAEEHGVEWPYFPPALGATCIMLFLPKEMLQLLKRVQHQCML